MNAAASEPDAPVIQPAPHWSSTEGDVVLHLGDCLDVLPSLPECSVDAVVTDPPAAVSFMGKSWDSDRGGRDKWVAWLAERTESAARCLKPGGHLLVWSLPRTSHWTALALEDAGLEIRDCITHVFGSGFPKSLDVSRAIDKAAGATREAATEGAARWEGWGTALKPGQEMWWLARKPLAEGNVAANVLEHGTGALNVDGCRAGTGEDRSSGGLSQAAPGASAYGMRSEPDGRTRPEGGRWPANVLLSHSAQCEMTRNVRGNIRLNPTVVAARANVAKGAEAERVRGARGHGNPDGTETVEAWSCADDCPVAELDRQSGVRPSGGSPSDRLNSCGIRGNALVRTGLPERAPDSGGASRFFPVFRYEAKAPASERPRLPDGTGHPTVKPLDLMRWLVRLVTPPGGTVLDLFAGTGTTAEACVIEGFRCVLIEQDRVNAELAKVRLSKPIQPDLFGGAA